MVSIARLRNFLLTITKYVHTPASSLEPDHVTVMSSSITLRQETLWSMLPGKMIVQLRKEPDINLGKVVVLVGSELL